ncbi:MAG: type 4a pilus biogenesis protein PilO [Candidatus Thioglobus sp.]|nr:type 4a pilus biogenesis protein PilO [Candidatus Thioglobus sp.]
MAALSFSAKIKDLLGKKESNKMAVNSMQDIEENSEVARYQQLLIVLTLAIVSIAAAVATVYYPYQAEISELERKYKKIGSLKKDLAQINGKLDIQTALLEEKRVEYERLTRIFHSESELEELYESISKLAIRYGMKVSGFSRKRPEAIYEERKKGKKKKKRSSDREVLYYKMKVDISMTGNYLAYMRFIKGLSELKKAVNTEEETITMDNEKGGGNVNVHVTLSTYRLP